MASELSKTCRQCTSDEQSTADAGEVSLHKLNVVCPSLARQRAEIASGNLSNSIRLTDQRELQVLIADDNDLQREPKVK